MTTRKALTAKLAKQGITAHLNCAQKLGQRSAAAIESIVNAAANHLRGMPMLEFFVKVATVTESNSKEHWRTRAKRAKEQRSLARLTAATALQGARMTLFGMPFPWVVLMTRVSSRELDDDNLYGALKHIRDGIADWASVDDRRSSVIKYEYAQERGKPAGVRVEIRPMVSAEVV